LTLLFPPVSVELKVKPLQTGREALTGECDTQSIAIEPTVQHPVRKDHNAGGRSNWMQGVTPTFRGSIRIPWLPFLAGAALVAMAGGGYWLARPPANRGEGTMTGHALTLDVVRARLRRLRP
jgi:hypothetical protein